MHRSLERDWTYIYGELHGYDLESPLEKPDDARFGGNHFAT